MFAAVFGQRDFAVASARAQLVQPGVLDDGEQPAGQARAAAELLMVPQRALDGELHEIVRVVLVAGQRAREAAQPRQQRDDAFTDFLRRGSHAFMMDDTSG